MPEIIFSCDVEDPRPDESYPKRYPEIIEGLLTRLEVLDIKGTFFFVGKVAKADPELVKKTAALGHEIGFHSMYHKPLTTQSTTEFEEETRVGKQLLEDISATQVVGYRAPIFSLTRQSLWAVDILKELGFEYSSSVLPAGSPLFGLPGAPFTPFRWHNGLLELPAPLASIGGAKIPYLGGVYFRYLPNRLIRFFLGKTPQNQCLWTYCHPHDFDTKQPFYRMKETALWISWLLWLNRKRTFSKYENLLKTSPAISFAPPFSEQLHSGKFDLIPCLPVTSFT